MKVFLLKVLWVPSQEKLSKTKAESELPERRSCCPVSCALDLFGDRWTLLVIRDLMLGRTRFKDFAGSPENIPTNILSNRLERLQEGGLVEQVPAVEGGKRMAYVLTEKGKSLKPVMLSIRKWGLEWEEGTAAKMVPREGGNA